MVNKTLRQDNSDILGSNVTKTIVYDNAFIKVPCYKITGPSSIRDGLDMNINQNL